MHTVARSMRATTRSHCSLSSLSRSSESAEERSHSLDLAVGRTRKGETTSKYIDILWHGSMRHNQASRSQARTALQRLSRERLPSERETCEQLHLLGFCG